MQENHTKPRRVTRPIAVMLSALLGVPFFASCASDYSTAPPPPVDGTVGRPQAYPAPNQSPQARQRFSNRDKLVVLAGAAALYYLYNQHKNRQQQGAQGQYYLSKNGRVYYRDAQGRPHWVTPPPEGIAVPESEAYRYQDFQGYNNRPTGRDLRDLVPQDSYSQDPYSQRPYRQPAPAY